MIGLSCYILADTFFISKALGPDGLTALNLALPVYSIIHGCGLMIGIGAGTKYSIFKSQRQTKEANQVFTNAACFTLSFAVLFFLLGLFGSNFLVRILGADETIFQMCHTYLRVILLFSPLFLINNLLICFVRNDGSPQLAMAAMLLGSFANIILDYLFMFPLHMGMLGAVLATGFAPVISILILSFHFFQKKAQFRLIKCPISRRLLHNIASTGLPSLIAEFSSGIVILVFNMLLLQLSGNIGVAAYGVVANLSLVILSIFTGIAQGIQPIISRNYGIGNQKNTHSILRYALITTAILSLTLYAGIFFGAKQITDIFNSQQNPLLQSISEKGLRIYFTACLFAGGNIILSVFFTSTDRPRPAQIISMLRGFIIIIPMAFILAMLGGVTGVWCAFPLTELLVCILSVILLIKNVRQ